VSDTLTFPVAADDHTPVCPHTRALRARAHEIIAGHAHPCAKAKDEFRRIAPPCLRRRGGGEVARLRGVARYLGGPLLKTVFRVLT